jgi:hypothetical protein
VGSCHDGLSSPEDDAQGSKITALRLCRTGLLRDSVVRSCSRAFGVGGSFSLPLFVALRRATKGAALTGPYIPGLKVRGFTARAVMK